MLSKFERSLPWSGAVAGLCWIGHELLAKTDTSDAPGSASAAVIHNHLGANYAAVGSLVLMGIALLFFATAVRNLLRSSEAREATYSSIAYGGWIVVVAGLGQMVVSSWAMINGAADTGDDAALHVLSYSGYFGFAGMGIGIASAFLAIGLGGIRNAVLPKWFAIATVVLGALSALGNAGIPPGGLVNYLLLPFWLIAAAVIVARRQHTAAMLPTA
ncbi:hypothetical protein [Kribbella sp. NPDC049584]|uniref:hypothetical protein n=1 Tax=Kribbella sp. NPDC049584 TaxID=3154833 RepID=UPI00341F437B